MASTKSYWSTLKMFLNDKIIQVTKISKILKGKRKFLSFFTDQCSLINNSSKHLSAFLKRTEKVISLISFSSNDFVKINRHLSPMVMI